MDHPEIIIEGWGCPRLAKNTEGEDTQNWLKPKRVIHFCQNYEKNNMYSIYLLFKTKQNK